MITGITGFAGTHLARFLGGLDGVDVAGLDLREPGEEFNAAFDGIPPRVHRCDLGDTETLTALLRQESPDAIAHLAARAQVAGAWDNATAIMQANVTGTQSLMQAAHAAVPKARVLVVSSSEVYGQAPPEAMPFTEHSPLKPSNPYSASKAAQEFIGLQYYYAFGAPVIIARPFNHIGPGQRGNFAVPAFASQIAAMEAGLQQPVLKVGNLESERDFTDVRDIVRAYWLLLDRGEPGQAYNIASGRAHRIREILDTLIGLSEISPRVENIPELMRPSDTPLVIGDASELQALGAWEPAIPLVDSLRDALDYWRRQARPETN